jgi:membrane-bound lytic murein transglycosylase D
MTDVKRIFRVSMLAAMLLFGNVYAQIAETDTTEPVNETVLVENVADSTVPEALIRERLAKLQNEIPLRYHAVTHQFVEYFIYRKPSFVKRMLEQMHLYFPMYEKTLEKYDMPRELKFLSLIESGLNPRVISYAGAGGLWQFMPRTGKEFGMLQDDYVDERFDPLKATEAACRYLTQLHRVFGDWEMALAAYNVGPGNVKRAMRRAGGKATFWEIYNFLPKQTRHYVPQFVAITYLMHYHADHGIFPENPEYPVLTDTVQISGYFNLHKFAKMSGISLEEIYKLNPHIINTELPARTRGFAVKIPIHRQEFLTENRLAIWDSCSRLPFDPTLQLAAIEGDSSTKIAKIGGLVAASDEEEDPETIIVRRPKKSVHVVRRGETLAGIANRYHVEVYDLKKWNRLRGSKVIRGSKIVVYKASTKTSTRHLAQLTDTKKSPKGKIKLRYHRVQQGDTLWTISQRYGVSSERLRKLNRIKGTKVRAGQKLLIG